MNRLRSGRAVQNRHLKISVTTAILTGIKLVGTMHVLKNQSTRQLSEWSKYSSTREILYSKIRFVHCAAQASAGDSRNQSRNDGARKYLKCFPWYSTHSISCTRISSVTKLISRQMHKSTAYFTINGHAQNMCHTDTTGWSCVIQEKVFVNSKFLSRIKYLFTTQNGTASSTRTIYIACCVIIRLF
jgi:hypothetical protein